MADEPLTQDAIEALIAAQAAAGLGDPVPAEPEPAGFSDAPLSPEEIAALIDAETGGADPVEPVAHGAELEPVHVAAPEPVVEDVQFSELPPVEGPLEEVADIDLLLDVPLQITVELGQATRTIRELLELGRGSILHLNRNAGEPVDVLVNGQHIARGEVVVIDESFGIRVTEVVSQADRLRSMAE
jgi:flagellar motor switch protein FliN/FliY